MGGASSAGVSELRACEPRTSRGQPSSQSRPNFSPIRIVRNRNARLIVIDAIASIFCELFDGLVIRENVAVNAAEQGDRYFQNGDEELIGRLPNLPVGHRWE